MRIFEATGNAKQLILLILFHFFRNGVQVVAGSNPVAPTRRKNEKTIALA
jgi:hypothetical protein